MSGDRALAGIRVLELSGLSGAYCGKLFADMGAQVTLIEEPEGSPMRGKGPFIGDIPGPDNSLAFAYFAANKASIVAELGTPEGLALLRQIVAEADLVILADHPAADCIDLECLRAVNPRLVCTRITPYGTEGPYAAYTGDDLALMAMGGLLSLAGFPDRPPVTAYGEQGLLAAEQFAAVSSLAAVLSAEQSGQGDLIDVSIQQSIVMALENAAQTYQLEGRIRGRTGSPTKAGTGIYPCKDGEIYMLAGGIGDTPMWSNFSEWMATEGIAGAERFSAEDWDDTVPGAEEHFAAVFLPFAAQRTKGELYTLAREWRVPMAPMSTTPDLLQNAQLMFRRFFVPCPAGSPATDVLMPGAPYKLSETPWSLRNAAPGFDDRQVTRDERQEIAS